MARVDLINSIKKMYLKWILMNKKGSEIARKRSASKWWYDTH